MSRDWTIEELQAASDAMKSMGFPSYEEFCAELVRLTQQKNRDLVYRYYIQVPHMTADRLPAGCIRFERWNSKPYCKDAGMEIYGVVEYSRPLSIQEMTIFGLGCSKM